LGQRVERLAIGQAFLQLDRFGFGLHQDVACHGFGHSWTPCCGGRHSAGFTRAAQRRSSRIRWQVTFPFTRSLSMNSAQNPLHGVTLEHLLTELVEHYGWPGLAQRIDIRCFSSDPSIKSSLTFLRKTPWARDKVEALYVQLRQRKG